MNERISTVNPRPFGKHGAAGQKLCVVGGKELCTDRPAPVGRYASTSNRADEGTPSIKRAADRGINE